MTSQLNPFGRHIALAGLFGLALAAANPGMAQAPPANPASAPIAQATLVEGTAFVTRADGRQTILARGSALGTGDVLSTSRNSTVRLRFTDGGETAIRPDSRISVQQYSYQREEPQSDSLIISLLKGGLRAITGSIGKRGNVDAYRLNVNTATIGIRGTDYTARLCNNDCAPDGNIIAQTQSQPRPAATNSGPMVIARVVRAQGAITVERGSRQVDVVQGGPLYASDKVATSPGGYAVLAFRDDTRITLNSGTQLALSQFSYDAVQPARSNMLFQLLQGGLRIATGLIGKAAPDRVKFQTATATIGIRGTLFDIAFAGASGEPTEDLTPGDPAALNCDTSLLTNTRSGEITLAAADGKTVALGVGQSGLVPCGAAPARMLANTPAVFSNQNTPAPETVAVDLPQLFGSAEPAPDTQGVYLLVREGKIVVGQAGQTLALDAGESGFAGQSLAPTLLASTPILLNRDPTLSDKVFNFNICRP